MRFTASVLALSVLSTLAPFAVAQKRPAPVDLGTLGGSYSTANGTNTYDTVVGGANVFGDVYTHAVYTNSAGFLVDVGSLLGVYGNSVANSIGNKGAITGTSDQVIDSDGDVASHAFYLTGPRAAMVDLGTNGGTLASGNATQNGQVAGAATVAGDVAYTAFYWTKAGGMLNLNTLAGDFGAEGYNSYAYGIDSVGVVVGSSDSPDGTTHAVAWAAKTHAIFDLKTLGGSYAQANAVNDNYMIVGFSTLEGDAQTDAFISQKGAGLQDIGTLGGSYAQANAVNNNGVVVGSSNITGDTDVHAFVWTQGGGMVDLNSLLPDGSPWDLSSANGVAPDGSIVGVGIINGEFHGFLW